MRGSTHTRNAELRQCIYCGKTIRRGLAHCPHCREAQTEVSIPSASPQRSGRGGQFRTGLLLVLMGAVIEYFAGGYSPMTLPDQVRTPMTTYLVPLLFVSGFGVSLYGVFQRLRA
jgi:hypothetical protein